MTPFSPNDLFRRIVGPHASRKPDPAAAELCAECGSDATAIGECRRTADDQWSVQLRCGGCGSWRELVVSDAALCRMDRALMTSLQAIERDLQTLERELFVADLEAFVVALERDLIDADDFASRLTDTR